MQAVKIPEEYKGVIAVTPLGLTEIVKGMTEREAKDWVRAMRKDPKFGQYVIKPTQRQNIVMIDKFFEFLRHKDENKLKG